MKSRHVALLLLGLLPLEASAMSLVPVRGGDHPGHGRVVFDWPRPTRYQLEEPAAGQVMLRFASPAEFDLAPVRRGVRNLAGIRIAGEDAAELATLPGVRVRHFRLGGRVVVDLLDPPGLLPAAATAPAVAEAAAPAPAPAPPVPILLAQAPALPGRPSLPALPTVTQPAPPAPAGVPGAPVPVQLRLEAGTGRLLALPSAANTVMAADPRVARVQPASPTSIFIMAVANGRTTIIATSETGQPVAEFDVTVFGGRGEREGEPRREGEREPAQRPLNAAQIQSQIRTLLGGHGQVNVRVAGRVIALSGTVSTAADARRAEAIARGMGNEDTEVLNELAVLSSIQVNLRVRVAEISREVTRQFGLNWQALGASGNFLIGLRSGASAGFLANSITGGVAAGALTAPQRLGLAYRAGSTDINSIIDALAADNLVTILAEPNLTAQSGEVASFLAGGEFPIPVSARDNTVSIEFKQFGVSLAFIPTVLAPERLALRVRPEVSELTDQGAISLPFAGSTITIPALSVRRAETTIELGSGQSFAIAGLLQRNSAQVQQGLNGLTDIPVLGALFRSDRFNRRETELVIIVTPYLVRPVSDPAQLVAPTDGFRPATSLERILFQRQLRGGAPQAPVPAGLGFRLQ